MPCHFFDMPDIQRPRATRTLRKQAPPAGIYESRYSPELAAHICARLAAGQSLRSICRHDPAMPTEKTVWNWAQQHPGFAFQKAEAQNTARKAALALQAKGDAAKRQAKKDKRKARGWRPFPKWRSGYTRWRADAICERLMVGESLAEICRDRAMPSIATVYNWLRRHAEFVEAYREARAVQADVIMALATEQAPWLGSWSASMRALREAETAALRRCAHLWPTRYGVPAGGKPLVVEWRTRPDGTRILVARFEEPPYRGLTDPAKL
jgi:hypothetical protein